jgi:tRNA-splicing ligase RtcB
MGAVSAFDEKEGIISAGLCGFDINCGVNLIRTNLTADEVRKHIKELVPALFKAIPCGVGATGKLRLQPAELNEVLTRGVNWAVEKGYATKEDLEATEEHGCMEGADPSKISPLALKRGVPQLGTLGAGNHFLEIQEVSDILDPTTAKKWGIHSKKQAMIMLHCGSRGLGHQVATDYMQIQEKAVEKYKIWLPDRQLACAPATSKEGHEGGCELFFHEPRCDDQMDTRGIRIRVQEKLGVHGNEDRIRDSPQHSEAGGAQSGREDAQGLRAQERRHPRFP